jgi:hypothetical protein
MIFAALKKFLLITFLDSTNSLRMKSQEENEQNIMQRKIELHDVEQRRSYSKQKHCELYPKYLHLVLYSSIMFNLLCVTYKNGYFCDHLCQPCIQWIEICEVQGVIQLSSVEISLAVVLELVPEDLEGSV